MAYDEVLAQRIRLQIGPMPKLVEKKMFGGVGFILNGNMACGAYKEFLLVRVSPAETAAALSRPHTRLMDITGRKMSGWIMVTPEGVVDEDSLTEWINWGIRTASALPPK